jgi:hypothetical protein
MDGWIKEEGVRDYEETETGPRALTVQPPTSYFLLRIICT